MKNQREITLISFLKPNRVSLKTTMKSIRNGTLLQKESDMHLTIQSQLKKFRKSKGNYELSSKDARLLMCINVNEEEF